MCAYCYCADWARDRIWPTYPFIPAPDPTPVPGPYDPRPLIPPPLPPGWSWERLHQIEDLIERVKRLEEKIDPCPCPEADKVKWIQEMREILDRLEGKEPPRAPDQLSLSETPSCNVTVTDAKLPEN